MEECVKCINAALHMWRTHTALNRVHGSVLRCEVRVVRGVQLRTGSEQNLPWHAIDRPLRKYDQALVERQQGNKSKRAFYRSSRGPSESNSGLAAGFFSFS
eukprot:SAG11_NODE_16059_length_558_cov_0.533769_1_plen_100_part_10